jgi:prefoldin subunit 5
MTKTKRKLKELEIMVSKLEKEISFLKDQINMLGIRSSDAPSFKDIVDEWTNGAKR